MPRVPTRLRGPGRSRWGLGAPFIGPCSRWPPSPVSCDSSRGDTAVASCPPHLLRDTSAPRPKTAGWTEVPVCRQVTHSRRGHAAPALAPWQQQAARGPSAPPGLRDDTAVTNAGAVGVSPRRGRSGVQCHGEDRRDPRHCPPGPGEGGKDTLTLSCSTWSPSSVGWRRGRPAWVAVTAPMGIPGGTLGKAGLMDRGPGSKAAATISALTPPAPASAPHTPVPTPVLPEPREARGPADAPRPEGLGGRRGRCCRGSPVSRPGQWAQRGWAVGQGLEGTGLDTGHCKGLWDPPAVSFPDRTCCLSRAGPGSDTAGGDRLSTV